MLCLHVLLPLVCVLRLRGQKSRVYHGPEVLGRGEGLLQEARAEGAALEVGMEEAVLQEAPLIRGQHRKPPFPP